MIVAFTGPSRLTREQELVVVKRLETPPPNDGDIWRSGCAYGVDTVAAHQANLVGIGLELFIPLGTHNDRLVEELTGYAQKVLACGDYRDRNEVMVTGADVLVAFAKRDSFYRSGEWMTINIAKRLKVPVELNVI